ncbi:unnamed protein product [Ectocarpus sp. 12 AP-2014]
MSGGHANSRDQDREDRRLAEMDAMGSEVFNLKLAVQEYEDRLAKLYQTEDRSKWRGPATLLTDLDAADQEVDRLENTVSKLRDQLHGARGGGGSSSDGGGGGSDSEYDSTLWPDTPRHQASLEELREQIAGLEEDNRVLAGAAGWELCGASEGEEDDALLVPTGPSQRVQAIEGMSNRMKKLSALLDSTLEREADARAAAEDAYSRMDDAITRTEELEVAVSLYKKEKESAEGRESALRTEMEEERSRAANRPPPADKEGDAEVVSAGAGAEKASMGVTTGTNTEEEWPAVDTASDKLEALEADVKRWQEACDLANAQMLKEKSLAEETARQLSEKEAAVRELNARITAMEAAAAEAAAEAAATAAAAAAAPSAIGAGGRSPTGLRQVANTVGPRTPEGDETVSRDQEGEMEGDGVSSYAPPASAAAAAAAAATAAASSDSDSGSVRSAALTDDDGTWKGRARASTDTVTAVDDAVGRITPGAGAAGDGDDDLDVSSSSSPRCEGDSLGRADGELAATAGSASASAADSPSDLVSGEDEFHGDKRVGQGERHGGTRRRRQQQQRSPRGADAGCKTKEPAGGRGKMPTGEQQLRQKQHDAETLDLEYLSGSSGSSGRRRTRRRRREEIAPLVGGGDVGDIDKDELSTAECSADTGVVGGGGGGAGGGGNAVGVGFDVSSEVQEEGEEDGRGQEGEQQAVGVRLGRSDGLDRKDQRLAFGEEVANALPPVSPAAEDDAEQQQQQQQHSDWQHTQDQGTSVISPGQRPATGAAATAVVLGSDELAAATQRAESAALRAEASAQRATLAAKSARDDREGAEMSALEANAAVAAMAKGTKSATSAGADPTATAAPVHGSFGGGHVSPCPPVGRESPAAGLRYQEQEQPPEAAASVVDSAEGAGRAPDGRRAARRARMTARLEALAAATDAERGAGRYGSSSSSCSSSSSSSSSGSRSSSSGSRSSCSGELLSPWNVGGAAAATAGTTVAAPQVKDHYHQRSRDGMMHHHRPAREEDTEASSPRSGITRSSEAGYGRMRASGSAQDVDYWNRPATVAAAMAAVAAVARGDESAQRARRTGGANPKPSAASLLDGGGEMGKRIATTGGAARGEVIDVLNNDHGSFAGTLMGRSSSEASFGAPPPPLSEAAAAVSREASRRRQRILKHVEVGRGGQEHYHDAAAAATAAAAAARRCNSPAETAGPPYGGVPADASAADSGAPFVVDDGFYGDCLSPLERRSTLVMPPRTIPPPRGWDGGAVGTSRPKAKATKKRKNRSTAPAAADSTPKMDRRRFVCRFQAHGGRCARVCASSACPCGGGRQQAPKATTPAAAAWRLPRAPISAWR